MTREERYVDALRLIDTMSVAELNELGHAMKGRYNELREEAKAEFKVGDLVWFDAKRRGRVEGKVVSRFGKNIEVVQTSGWARNNGTRWKVGPTLLHHREQPNENDGVAVRR